MKVIQVLLVMMNAEDDDYADAGAAETSEAHDFGTPGQPVRPGASERSAAGGGEASDWSDRSEVGGWNSGCRDVRRALSVLDPYRRLRPLSRAHDRPNYRVQPSVPLDSRERNAAPPLGRPL